jgi:hypothetical protein
MCACSGACGACSGTTEGGLGRVKTLGEGLVWLDDGCAAATIGDNFVLGFIAAWSQHPPRLCPHGRSDKNQLDASPRSAS